MLEDPIPADLAFPRVFCYRLAIRRTADSAMFLGSYFPPSSFGRKVKEENRKIVRVSICSITKILFLGALPSGSEPTQLGKAKSRDPSLLQSQHQLENER